MLTTISWIALIIGIVSFIIIAVDVFKHPQMMTIMNIVWPINGWFFGPFAIWTYFKWGRLKAKDSNQEDERQQSAKIFVSASHCAGGCTFGDIVGVPIVALTGMTIAGSTLFAHYLVEFILAYLFGIIFQFLAIYPMQQNKHKFHAFKSAIKADTWSVVTFQIGMFGWMAVVHYLLFSNPPTPVEPTFWFMMQIAMILGFLVSYPANWWLIQKGIKEAM
ncbi:DUF4396 domain-containing protein [Alkalibacillus sp. S2W]|uniref:DUF4396 domain-containing protein n=1 Tax=Alkalibacillus sp. S2W TaxID=3386553 RepID=UPI00398D3B59